MTTEHQHEPDGRTPILPEAFSALTHAARRSSRRRRRLPHWRGAALGLAIVAVSGTAVAATQNWAGVFDGGKHASIATAPVPPAQLRVFGVLRREQTDSDRDQAVRAVVRRMYGRHTFGEQEIHLDGVRVLERGARTITLLVPVGRIEYPGDAGKSGRKPPPTRRNQLCLEVATTIGIDLSKKPDKDGRPVLIDGKTLDDPTLGADDFQISGTCGSLGDLRRGRMRFEDPRTGQMTGLALDGIVAVQMTSVHGETVMGTVHDNLFHITRPLDRPGFRGRPVRGITPDGRLR